MHINNIFLQQQERRRKIDLKNSALQQKNIIKQDFYKETNRADINKIGRNSRILPRLRIQSPTNHQNSYGNKPQSSHYGNIDANSISPSNLSSTKKLMNYSYSNKNSPKTPKTSLGYYRFGIKQGPDRYSSLSQSRQELLLQNSQSSKNKLQNYYDQSLTYNSSSNNARHITLSQSSEITPFINNSIEKQMNPSDSLNGQAQTAFQWKQTRQFSLTNEKLVDDYINNAPLNQKIKNTNENKMNYVLKRGSKLSNLDVDKNDYYDLLQEKVPPSHRDIRQSYIDVQLRPTKTVQNNQMNNNHTQSNYNQSKTPIRETLEQENTLNSSLSQQKLQEVA